MHSCYAILQASHLNVYMVYFLGGQPVFICVSTGPLALTKTIPALPWTLFWLYKCAFVWTTGERGSQMLYVLWWLYLPLSFERSFVWKMTTDGSTSWEDCVLCLRFRFDGVSGTATAFRRRSRHSFFIGERWPQMVYFPDNCGKRVGVSG